MIMLGFWVCVIPFGLIMLMLLALLSSRMSMKRELDELNQKVAEVKAKQQYNEGNLVYLSILAFLLTLPFLTLAELIMLGHRLVRCQQQIAVIPPLLRGGKAPPLML